MVDPRPPAEAGCRVRTCIGNTGAARVGSSGLRALVVARGSDLG